MNTTDILTNVNQIVSDFETVNKLMDSIEIEKLPIEMQLDLAKAYMQFSKHMEAYNTKLKSVIVVANMLGCVK